VNRFDVESAQRQKVRRPEEDQEDADELYLNRLDAGLFTLQQIDLVIAEICCGSNNNNNPLIRERVAKILSMKKCTVQSVKSVLTVFQQNLDDDGSADAVENRAHVAALLAKL